MSTDTLVGLGPGQPGESEDQGHNFVFSRVGSFDPDEPFCPHRDGHERQRDLLPLPLLPDHLSSSPKVERHVSSSAKRNAIRRSHNARQVNDAISAINMMAGHKHSVVGEPSQAQREAQFNLLKQVSRSPSSATRVQQQEAVHELLRVSLSSYECEDEARSTVRSYDKGLTSLPECGSQVFEASELLDDVGRDILQDPREHLFLPDATIDRKIKPYMDDVLSHDSKAYHEFILDLWSRGMIRFGSDRKSSITPFFVIKKNQRLRLVLDCRATNQLFRQPPDIAMAAGYTFSQLEISSEATLFCAQSDIKDYFYSIGLPEYLHSYFCLPPIRPSFLRDQIPELQGMSDHIDIFPQMRVVPMGWNWAMYFAQRIHQHQVMIGANLQVTQILADGRPPPDLSSGQTIVVPYADNLNVLGTCKQDVQRVKDAAVSQLRRVGFRVHEEEDAMPKAKALGFIIDGVRGRIHPVPEKRDKIISALRWLAQRPRVSGHALERIIGRCIHLFMLRREFLSLFRSVYDFKIANPHKRARLWRSAATECEWAANLLPLCEADLRKPWSEHVTVSDACLTGTATCALTTDPRVVQQVGIGRELWRFRSTSTSRKARDAVLALDPFVDIETALPWKDVHDPFSLNHEFENVPRDLALHPDWKVMFSSHMKLKEPITVLEGRATLQSIRHKSRSTRHFGKKHLHLGDNLGMVLSFDRGRAKSIPLLFCCRRALAYSLATGSQYHHRWIPSEFNAADAASRQWEPKSAESDQETSQAAASKKRRTEFINQILYPSSACRSRRQGPDTQKCIQSHIAQQSAACHADSNLESSSCQRTPTSFENKHVRHPSSAQGQRSRRTDPEEIKVEDFAAADTEVSRSDLAGIHGGVPKHSSRLCQKGCRLSDLLQDSATPLAHSLSGRLRPDHLSERELPRGTRHCRWPEVSSCSSGGVAVPGKNRAHSKQKVAKGVEKFGPRLHKTTAGLAFHQPNGHDHDRDEPLRCSPLCANYVCGICSAKRGPQADGARSHLLPRFGTSLCSECELNRRDANLQGGHVRRSDPLALKDSELSRTSTQEACRSTTSPRASVPPAVLQTSASLEGGSEETGATRKLCSAIPTSPLRGIMGCLATSSISPRDQAERTMVSRCESEALRVPCQGGSNIRETASCHQKESGGISSITSGNGWRIYHPSRPNGLKPTLELFAGCAALSKSLCHQGFTAYAYDLDWGSQGDVLKQALFHSLMHDIKQQRFSFVHFGMPCESWSRARKWDGGPPPLRDDGPNLYGFTNRPLADLLKIQKGNDLLQRTSTLAHQCISAGIPWAIENPLTSRAWETEEMNALLSRGAEPQHVHYCQYDKPWRKATTFLGWKVPSFNFRLCTGTHGVCSASGLRHTILQGKNKDGIFRTLIAQPYPKALVRHMAKVLASAL